MCITQGVEYESHSVEIKPELKALYNEACDVWYEVSSDHNPGTVSVMPAFICGKGLVGRSASFCATTGNQHW